jgi:hypothetical protein
MAKQSEVEGHATAETLLTEAADWSLAAECDAGEAETG